MPTNTPTEAKEFRSREKGSLQGVQLDCFGSLKGLQLGVSRGVQLDVFGGLKARGAVGNLRAQGGTVGCF